MKNEIEFTVSIDRQIKKEFVKAVRSDGKMIKYVIQRYMKDYVANIGGENSRYLSFSNKKIK